jgi:serine/threonine protein kinase
MEEAASQRCHLVALPPTAKVIPMDNIRRQGGYATIRRVRLKGVPEFKPWWEFVAKQSNQIDKRNDLVKMEYQNEAMAVTIPHVGVIRFAAIHAEKYEGYAFWWNGGTLRDMFNLDNRYGNNIAAWVAYENTSGDELLRAEYLRWFQKKRMELAWALLYIMDEVHKSHNLHNDISPDNILLHFPEEESKVYIRVCD